MCVKIVAECKEYELLETVAIQDTQDKVFFFIQYLYPDETRPETRKRPKNWACIFFTISSGKLDIFIVLHARPIWDKLEAI